MVGPAKKRAQAENKGSGSSEGRKSSQESSGRDVATQRSTPKSIPRLDGNRDPIVLDRNAPITYTKPGDLKNISEFLGMRGWYTARGIEIPDSLPYRPSKFNTLGTELAVTLNTYNVIQAPSTTVHQYDIAWGQNTDATKRVLIKKIWNSKAVKAALGEPLHLWIYDGNKLAWSVYQKLDRDEMRITVNLDEEEAQDLAAAGKPKRGRACDKDKNTHTLFVKWTRKVDFAHLTAFLSGHAPWSPDCIDTVNFLDHVMREEPSRKYTQIKKSFFQRGEKRYDLGGGIEAFKGVFSSLRPVLNDKFEKSLSVNVDVANGTFWRAQELARAIQQVFNQNLPQFQTNFLHAKRDWRHSQLRKDLSRFKRLGVTATHNKENLTQWTIEEICQQDCHEASFTDPDDKRDIEDKLKRKITVYKYYKQKYGIECIPRVPVVKMTKKIRKGPVYIPMEHLKINPNQRYNSKLSDKQTSEMIKFAVTLPTERWAAVEHGVRLLDWGQDRYLKHYGIKISTTPAKVKARQLPYPTITFAGSGAGSTISPKDCQNGRWRLDGKTFIAPNQREITSWGICVIQGRGALAKPAVEHFARSFIRTYESHGGKFSTKFNKLPHIVDGNLARGGDMIADAWNAIGNKFQARPMFMMFIVNDRNVEVYRRIKKSCDCRYGVPSQVVQSRHAAQSSAQYLSNVCMKVNAKLGGATCFAKSTIIPKLNPKAASIPTMIIGADVSHPAPGAGSDTAASFAAIAVSNDTTFTRYWAECNTNGNRVEMVTTQNIDEHLGNMAKNWMTRVGRGQAPQRVLYIRDGVSEGQYAAVLEEEVRDMKECFRKIGCKTIPKFTVVIAGKRHHIRFFPDKGRSDRNNNPYPGVLVETGCTHPFEFDFYLCAHSAIKGTARPIHYQVILNEAEWGGMELQQFIFEHSFQYIRSTTPVSLHPAVYYAHLAADRSRAHENVTPVSSGKKEAKAEQKPESSSGSSKNKVEIQPLLALSNAQGLRELMWYV
ncbi:eukaryotic translation initiation factor 2C 2 [Lindgomyces ingoldianus]|uniref:Eukaryotic translation initiation factor 2C 2 n=1 Tax=Lindgomyces ingoldianus TaxID=673940 RepID=A0ACB6QTN2_9PLEO|nr:eukaryotic translation initiation factor 2C 2 [Lindgomyces ingoldianus]KAF2470296.1 eukaryotic translation initiation factor 2C 2 [Lindgomyces ingoldianus]